MNIETRSCNACGESYGISSGGNGTERGDLCPGCRKPLIPTGPAVLTLPRLKFAGLKELSPEKPLRPRVVYRPQPVAKTSARAAMPVPPVLPPAPLPSRESSITALPNDGRQMGFNCPSCYTVLIIKDPQNYDGRPGPCPFCMAVIIPPRMAPASPFTLVSMPPAPPPKENPAALPATVRPFGRNSAVHSPDGLGA